MTDNLPLDEKDTPAMDEQAKLVEAVRRGVEAAARRSHTPLAIMRELEPTILAALAPAPDGDVVEPYANDAVWARFYRDGETLGEIAPADLPKGPGRGGARNRADRASDALTAVNVAHLQAATYYASKIGLPFTRMVTIHWQAAGVPLESMAKATGQLTDLLTKTLARHGSETAYVWIHEGGEWKGGHCHLLAHVPAEIVPIVSRLQRGWLRRITGAAYQRGVILSRPIGGRLGLECGNPDLHATNLEAAFAYICKAAPQSILDRFGIGRAHEPGGRIIGKRCGTSQNIGAKARERT